MAKFAYNAIDQAGKEQYGIVEGDTEADALNELGRRGLYPTEVRPANITDDWRVGRRDALRVRQEEDVRRHEQAKKRQTRQRLVVHYLSGETLCGVSFALNPREVGFHLDTTDRKGISAGKSVQVNFSELKSVFFVKSFDGKFDRNERFREWSAEGNEVVAVYKDGEVMEGFTLHPYNPNDPRFYIIPKDTESNNISVLVEASALSGVYTPEDYKAKKIKEREERRQLQGADVTQEETMGDFYFETRNYESAMDQYSKALKLFPQSQRLRKKKLAAFFNIGVQHIKQRNYPKALEVIEEVLKLDPENSHARKKVLQLRKIVSKSQRS